MRIHLNTRLFQWLGSWSIVSGPASGVVLVGAGEQTKTPKGCLSSDEGFDEGFDAFDNAG
jgi:hypothetical protein